MEKQIWIPNKILLNRLTQVTSSQQTTTLYYVNNYLVVLQVRKVSTTKLAAAIALDGTVLK